MPVQPADPITRRAPSGAHFLMGRIGIVLPEDDGRLALTAAQAVGWYIEGALGHMQVGLAKPDRPGELTVQGASLHIHPWGPVTSPSGAIGTPTLVNVPQSTPTCSQWAAVETDLEGPVRAAHLSYDVGGATASAPLVLASYSNAYQIPIKSTPYASSGFKPNECAGLVWVDGEGEDAAAALMCMGRVVGTEDLLWVPVSRFVKLMRLKDGRRLSSVLSERSTPARIP